MSEISAGPVVSIVDLREGTCRWPIGDPQDEEHFGYCGAPCELDRPYCGEHCAMAYVRVFVPESDQ